MVGLGIIGSAISASLMRAGHPVIGYDISAGRRRDHRRGGGEVASTCGELGTRAAIVITSLPSSDALRATADAFADSPRPPKIVVETSTLAIAVKEEARARLHARGITLLDCPLSGTGTQARAKDLVVYASGSRAAYRRVAPILDAFARARYYVGPFGCGSKTKLVANLLVAIHNVAAAEALLLAKRVGLDPKTTLEAIADGAGGSRMLEIRGPMMVKGDYSKASMKLDVWQKDLTLIAQLAHIAGSPTPLFTAAVPLYTAAISVGREDDDTAAVHAVLERMAGRAPKGRKD
jgi:3-hydroxyisobutyrate dehydrogenase-like beta-hydroxyacid dehydrogenase